jgi:aryl-alcohol dehydrogenase-like predicted oxidoreductase
MLPETYVDGFHDKESVAKMPYTKLKKTGFTVSKLSFGASALGSVFNPTEEKESIEVAIAAVRSGINLIDVAPWYGHGKAETVLGKSFKHIPRKAYYITTKVGRYFPEPLDMFDFSRERTLRSVEESLNRMGLDYIDIIQVHDMEFAPSLDIIIHETLPALLELKKAGKVRYIGITGYPLENFKHVIMKLEALGPLPIDSVLSYCRYALHDTSLEDYLPYFQEKCLDLINASPVCMGLLSHRGPPRWHPAPAQLRRKCADAALYCEKAGVNISKLALRFALDHPGIPTTLFSTDCLKILNENLKSVWEQPSGNEKRVLIEIREQFFTSSQNWEGIEVANYWKKIENRVDQGQRLLALRHSPRSRL